MAQQQQHQDVLIKWSGDYWKYMIINGGFLRILATGLEDTLAATGRSLLLIFLLYCGVKSGALLVAPTWKPELWLEMLMFLLQLGGLEGSIPGLARRADELRGNNNEVGAKRIDHVTMAARSMTIAAVAEGVLHIIFSDGTCPAFIFFGPTVSTMQLISGVLLILRTFVILTFLVELGKVDSKGPRILNKSEYEQERERAEQVRLAESEQGRMIAALRVQLDESQHALLAAQQREQEHEREREDQVRAIADMRQVIDDLSTRLADATRQRDTSTRHNNATNTDDTTGDNRKQATRQRDTSTRQGNATRQRDNSTTELSLERVAGYRANHPNATQQEIAAAFGVSVRTLQRKLATATQSTNDNGSDDDMQEPPHLAVVK